MSRTLLADLPAGQSLTVEEFVKLQERHIAQQSLLLQVGLYVRLFLRRGCAVV